MSDLHVWPHEYVDVLIYLEDANGNVIDSIDFTVDSNPIPTCTPVLQYCYMQGVDMQGTAAFDRKAVTGRGRRKLIPRSGGFDDCSGSVEILSFRKSETYRPQDIFNNFRSLRFVMRCEDFPLTKLCYILEGARSNNFQIRSSEGSDVTASLSFLAEAAYVAESP